MHWLGSVNWVKLAENERPQCLTLAGYDPNRPFDCVGPHMVLTVFKKFKLLRRGTKMKVRNSLKSLKNRHRDCRVIRRRGRTYVINKTNRRFKARQG